MGGRAGAEQALEGLDGLMLLLKLLRQVSKQAGGPLSVSEEEELAIWAERLSYLRRKVSVLGCVREHELDTLLMFTFSLAT